MSEKGTFLGDVITAEGKTLSPKQIETNQTLWIQQPIESKGYQIMVTLKWHYWLALMEKASLQKIHLLT